MKVIIGLGNPGKDYEKTRHNAGFLFVDILQKWCELPQFTFDKKFNAEITQGLCSAGKEKTLLVKPQTFMNRSGESVQKILEYYKIDPRDIIIVHDDLDIEIGRYKISHNIRAAGHNGVQDIILHLGTQEFTRMRIGVEAEGGKPERNTSSGSKFVLQRLSDEEYKKITETIEEIYHEIQK